jgi:electron transfer flavoprotein alpha subunit
LYSGEDTDLPAKRKYREGISEVDVTISYKDGIIFIEANIAVALSGAMSHITGHLGSKYLVAINKDKEANIFSVAHFGIVADYKEVLPALTAKLKELLSK